MLYHSLFVPVGGAPFPREVLNSPDVAKYVMGWGRPGDLAFISLESSTDDAVGAVWMRLFPDSDKGFGFVSSGIPELGIAVLPGCRGRGVGSALLRKLLEEVRAMYSGVSLSVSVDNPARRLYERFGFEVVDTHGNSVTMVKRFIETAV